MPTSTAISGIMTRGIFSVDINDTIRKVRQIMKNESVRHVPVLDNNKIIGVINERSVIEYTLRRYYNNEEGMEDQDKIADYVHLMRPVEHFIYPEDSVQKAINLMTKYHVDCIPVVDWEFNLEGLITSLDLLLYLNKMLDDENSNISLSQENRRMIAH